MQTTDCLLFLISTVRADFLDHIEQLSQLSRLFNKRSKRYLLPLTHSNSAGRHTRQRLTRDEAIQAVGNNNDCLGARVLKMLSGERPDNQPSDAHSGSLRLATTRGRGETAYVDLIHETLLRRRTPDNIAGTTPQPYWPAPHDFVEVDRDGNGLRQQLANK